MWLSTISLRPPRRPRFDLLPRRSVRDRLELLRMPRIVGQLPRVAKSVVELDRDHDAAVIIAAGAPVRGATVRAIARNASPKTGPSADSDHPRRHISA